MMELHRPCSFIHPKYFPVDTCDSRASFVYQNHFKKNMQQSSSGNVKIGLNSSQRRKNLKFNSNPIRCNKGLVLCHARRCKFHKELKMLTFFYNWRYLNWWYQYWISIAAFEFWRFWWLVLSSSWPFTRSRSYFIWNQCQIALKWCIWIRAVLCIPLALKYAYFAANSGFGYDRILIYFAQRLK